MKSVDLVMSRGGTGGTLKADLLRGLVVYYLFISAKNLFLADRRCKTYSGLTTIFAITERSPLSVTVPSLDSPYSPFRDSARAEAITMQLPQVRYFLALCEELNFTRAARRCGISQPSLTTAISVLERELGGALFDRKPSIALTALGRVVRPYLDEIARNADPPCEVARTLTPRPVADRSARQAVDSSEHLAN